MAVAVLVLQPLAVQRRAPGGAADEEAARPRIGGGPHQVADALHAEHRVEDEERDRGDAGRHRRGARRDERGHRASLGDPLLQDLAVLRLVVVEQVLGVDRLVGLAARGVDAELAEERLHAEGARLVGHDRARSACRCCLSRISAASTRTSTIVVEASRSPEPAKNSAKASGDGGSTVALRDAALRQRPAEGAAALVHVLDLGAVRAGPVERRAGHLLVGQRDAEAVAEREQLLRVEVLLLVRDVAALAGLAQAVALDRARQDDRRHALVSARRRGRRRTP